MLDETFERTATTPFAATIGCALRSTNGDREKSGAKNNSNNNEHNKSALRSALSGTGLPRVVCANTGRAETETERGALPQKARDFHARIAAARKVAGNCGRCGKPNTNGHRQCDRCRAYSKAYKARQAKAPRSIVTLDVTALMRRVCSLEMRLAKVETELAVRRNAYRYVRRRVAALKKTKQPYPRPPVMSYQEAATISHRYVGHNRAIE
jgi:hypothetical protein